MVTYVSVTPYADTTFADAYFADRTDSSAWEAASAGNKVKALKEATRRINDLHFIRSKTDADQINEFPRNGDTDVPHEVAEACCEVAAALLENKQLDKTLKKGTVRSEKTGDASVSYEKGGKRAHLDESAGLGSAVAFRLLRPWLVNFSEVELFRNR